MKFKLNYVIKLLTNNNVNNNVHKKHVLLIVKKKGNFYVFLMETFTVINVSKFVKINWKFYFNVRIIVKGI